MARPRVFISSTYFDLKTIRSDLEFFIKERGFDSVLHERGQVAYGKNEPLENYCYEEIESCDILVSIVGGRFGSQSSGNNYSISQNELKRALDSQKQVYVFVDRDVHHEYKTYVRNKGSSLKWASVDNEQIFEFLEEINGLRNNNAIMPFETSSDITALLREQWAGLFQRLLVQSAQQPQIVTAMELRHSLETARSLVEALSSQSSPDNSLVTDILLASHPVFQEIRKAVDAPYRVIFYDLDELDKWLKVRGYEKVEEALWDDSDCIEWIRNGPASLKTATILKVNRHVFDENGRIIASTASNWNSSWIKLERINKERSEDDVPF